MPGHVWTILGFPKLNDQGELCLVGGSANNPMIDIGGGVMTQALGVKLVEQRLLTAGNDGQGMQIGDQNQVMVQFSYDSPTANNPGIFVVQP